MNSPTDEDPLAASNVLYGLRIWAESRTAELLGSDLSLLDLDRRLPWLPRIALIALEQRADELNPTSRAALVEWRAEERRQAERFIALAEAASDNFQAALPPNWNNPTIELPEMDRLEKLLLDEGLPLAWLPHNSVLSDLLNSGSSAERLAVIGTAAEIIVEQAAAELVRLTSGETEEWRPFAAEAVESMRLGQWASGQALATNLLETLVYKFIRSSIPSAVRRSARPGSSGSTISGADHIDDGNFRALMVVLGVWGAYSNYPPGDFANIPTHFTRHASAHGVSAAQYNKTNAVIALMHVVAILCLVEEG
jgi:hypothetical protein